MSVLSSKKALLPLVTLCILLSAFLYYQYREQINESELQSFIAIDYYIEHLDGFLSYQRILIDNDFPDEDANEYNARKQALQLHGESSVVYLGYNGEDVENLREFPETLASIMSQFQSAETADERRVHYEEAREIRDELWHYRTDIQDYLHQKTFP